MTLQVSNSAFVLRDAQLLLHPEGAHEMRADSKDEEAIALLRMKAWMVRHG